MDTQIVFPFCLCDKVLKAIGYKEDPQCQMSTLEIMTFAMTAALFFNATSIAQDFF